jgi:hypothetical protein
LSWRWRHGCWSWGRRKTTDLRASGLRPVGHSARRPAVQCKIQLQTRQRHSAAEDGIRPRSAGSAVQRTAAGTTAVQCRIRPRSSSWAGIRPCSSSREPASRPHSSLPHWGLPDFATWGLGLGTWGCACAVAGRRGAGRRDPRRPGRFTKSPRRRKTATRVTRLGFLWGLDWPTGSLGLWELDLDGRTGLCALVAVTLGWHLAVANGKMGWVYYNGPIRAW